MSLITYVYTDMNHNDGTCSLDIRVANMTKEESQKLRDKMLKEIERLQYAKDKKEQYEEYKAKKDAEAEE